MGLLLFPVPCLNRTFLFPVSLNERNLPIRRSRNRHGKPFFRKPVHGLCVNTKSTRNMMSKKQLLLLLPALFAAISTLPANAAHILTGGGTGAANASGTGISMQLNQGFTSDTALPGAVNLDSIQLKLTDNRFTVDFTSGSLTMVVFTKPASDSADWTVVGQSRTEENLSVNIDSYTDVEFTFSNLLLNTSQEYVFAFVSDAAMLGRLTIGTSLQAEEGADSPFSVDNGFAYASMQSTAFYSGAPVILYYNTGNETSMYFPNMIVTVTDPESVPEPASCLLVTLSCAGLLVSRRRR